MWPNLEDFIKHLNSWLLFLYNYFFMSVLFFDWERKYFVMQTGIIKSCSENLFFKLNSKNKTFKKKISSFISLILKYSSGLNKFHHKCRTFSLDQKLFFLIHNMDKTVFIQCVGFSPFVQVQSYQSYSATIKLIRENQELQVRGRNDPDTLYPMRMTQP